MTHALSPALPAYDRDALIGATPEGWFDDASGLSAAPVHRHLTLAGRLGTLAALALQGRVLCAI